jgi:oligopeptide/dipeptide ABC transporter ATP-binding protein
VTRRPGIRGTPPELTDVTQGCVFAPRCDHRRDVCASITMAVQTIAPGHGSACPVRPFAGTPTGAGHPSGTSA